MIAIEPLADRFLDEVPWCDLNVAHAVYSQPAEHRIEALIGCADLVISINVLDHCYNFYQIISNIRAYLKPDGVAFLSFDEHKYRDSMHPLILSDEICHEVFRDNGLAVSRHTKGFGNVKWIAKGRESYGHGDFCLNYWLSSA
ncbi:MAG: class I SAM-dependent methyltransferase [Nitrococcus sp.]|nr:class I SAM-dependent methyltransferase [Nitrococcus sp.]